jgi:urocanate hydratase
MNDGICLALDVDEAKIRRRLEAGYLDAMAKSLQDALDMIDEAKAEGRPLSVGLPGNNSEVYLEVLRRSVIPDVVTDQSPCHDNELLQYVPAQMSLEEAAELRQRNPKQYMSRARESIASLAKTIMEFERRGSQVFEYGNGLRDQAQRAGLVEASRIPGFIEKYLRITHFCEGKSGQRWIMMSGDPEELRILDEFVLREFSDDKQVVNWIRLAKERVPIEGLPARICWFSLDQQVRFGKLVNLMVRKKELKAPVAFTRCALPICASPLDETRLMKDGSDAVADWPILNGMLDVAAGADLVNICGSYAGTVKGSMFTLVMDGTEESDERVNRVLLADAGSIVTRLADAGYERAVQITREKRISVSDRA